MKKAFIARIAGDMFIIILINEYTKEQIKVIAKKIIKTLAEKQEHVGISVHITASIGIANYPEDGNTAEEIIKKAENAMYKAKKRGRKFLGVL